MSRKTIALLLSLCACIFLGTDALAVTIDLTTRNSGPSNPLVFDGVTATNLIASGVGRPATVQGVGLGMDWIGSPGYVDRIDSYSRNPGGGWTWNASANRQESVSFQVNGTLNSLTVKPYFSVLQGESAQLPFEFGYLGVAGDFRQVTWEVVDPPFSPMTLSLKGGSPVDNTYILIASNFDETAYFAEYLSRTNFSEVSFQYGLTVTSFDYTSAQPVPEGGTLFLLCSGLIGIAGFRRRFIV